MFGNWTLLTGGPIQLIFSLFPAPHLDQFQVFSGSSCRCPAHVIILHRKHLKFIKPPFWLQKNTMFIHFQDEIWWNQPYIYTPSFRFFMFFVYLSFIFITTSTMESPCFSCCSVPSVSSGYSCRAGLRPNERASLPLKSGGKHGEGYGSKWGHQHLLFFQNDDLGHRIWDTELYGSESKPGKHRKIWGFDTLICIYSIYVWKWMS